MGIKKFSVVALALALVVGLFAAPPVTAKSKPKGTITGTVTLQGEPVAGALVYWKSKSPVDAATTDAQGRFTIKASVGTYKVSAYSTDHSAHRTWAGGALRKQDGKKSKVREGRTARVNIELAPAATVEGRVLDADGQPFAGVELKTRNLDRHGQDRVVETDADGRYSIPQVSKGRFEIATNWYEDRIKHHGSVIVRAKPGKTITAPDIRVTPPSLGTITADVALVPGDRFDTVTAVNVGGDDVDDTLVTLERDPQTQLWSGVVGAGTWRVTVEGTNVKSKRLRVEDGATVHAGSLIVPEERGVLKGKVRKKNGKIATRGRVYAYDALGLPAGWTKIKKNGTYKLKGLVPGKYWLTIQNADMYWQDTPPVRVRAKAGKTTKQNIKPKLALRHTIKGKVVHRGKGVRGVTVNVALKRNSSDRLWVSNYGVKTDAKGRFSISVVQGGTYTLTVKDKSPTYRFVSETVKIKGTVKGYRIKLKK